MGLSLVAATIETVKNKLLFKEIASFTRLLLTSDFGQCLIWSKWKPFLVSISIFWKISIVSISMSSGHRGRRKIRFFFHPIIKLRSIVGYVKTWVDQTRFYFWRYSAMACHYFNSRVFILEFTWNCCRLQEAKTFSRNPGQFKCVTRETRYRVSVPELLIRNI